MIRSLSTILVFTLGAVLLAQNPTPAKTTANTTILAPAPIPYGGGTIAGDSQVKSDLATMVQLNSEYKELQNQWTTAQAKLEADIKLVKTANKWGDDVTFDPASGWVRTLATTPATHSRTNPQSPANSVINPATQTTPTPAAAPKTSVPVPVAPPTAETSKVPPTK